jgi:hypothetical protein
LTGGVRDGIKVSGERIPTQEIQGFQSLIRTFLRELYLPPAWDQVEFYGLAPYPIKTMSEMRNGVPTFVRQEPDLTAEINELKEGDAVQTEWAVKGIEVLPRTTFYVGKLTIGALIRLRLHGDERLVLKPRPEDLLARGARGKFFDRTAFHGLLTKVFRVPFETSEDWLTDGFDATYEGVRVFHGKIVSREWAAVFRADRSRTPAHWWDEMRLLVTDSDPQYFCVSIALGRDDVIPAAQP